MNPTSLLAAVFAAVLLAIGVSCKPTDNGSGTVEPDPAEPPASTEPSEVTPAEASTFNVKNLDAAAASDLVDENAEIVVLDVRTPEEFAGGHIQGALNIDFKSSAFREEIAKLDPDKPYLVHCRSGSRSTSSLPVFEELGFTGIHHLDGGFEAWKADGNAYVTD